MQIQYESNDDLVSSIVRLVSIGPGGELAAAKEWTGANVRIEEASGRVSSGLVLVEHLARENSRLVQRRIEPSIGHVAHGEDQDILPKQ